MLVDPGTTTLLTNLALLATIAAALTVSLCKCCNPTCKVACCVGRTFVRGGRKCCGSVLCPVGHQVVMGCAACCARGMGCCGRRARSCLTSFVLGAKFLRANSMLVAETIRRTPRALLAGVDEMLEELLGAETEDQVRESFQAFVAGAAAVGAAQLSRVDVEEFWKRVLNK